MDVEGQRRPLLPRAECVVLAMVEFDLLAFDDDGVARLG